MYLVALIQTFNSIEMYKNHQIISVKQKMWIQSSSFIKAVKDFKSDTWLILEHELGLKVRCLKGNN